jgi:hypothetical protein
VICDGGPLSTEYAYFDGALADRFEAPDEKIESYDLDRASVELASAAAGL